MTPKPLNIQWTEPAVRDLDHIAEFIARDNPVQGAVFVLSIFETVETILPIYPGAGRAGRILGTRELVMHENYLVPYRVRSGTIEILRVLHAAQKWL